MLVKEGLGEAQQCRRWQPQGPERALTSQHTCDGLAWGSSYQAAELHCSLRVVLGVVPFCGGAPAPSSLSLHLPLAHHR